ncbi:MAG: zinc transporter ZupT [Oscillospiraceae bacterium]
MNNVILAFTLTLVAGLSTGIGSCIAFFSKKTNTKFLSIILGFSAGVMIYVSTIDIFPKSQILLQDQFGPKTGTLLTVISFFAGMLLICLIDKLIPHTQNPHEVKKVENLGNGSILNASQESHLMKTGLFTALALTIHNFPEGMATFIIALKEPTLAMPIVIAIALHNIPEGIAVSVPIYYATGDKKKAFLYSFASGLSEPIGALFAYLILMPFLNDTLYGMLFALVGGIMVFISLDELLPAAREYDEHHISIYGLMLGMAFMAFSLLLFV